MSGLKYTNERDGIKWLLFDKRGSLISFVGIPDFKMNLLFVNQLFLNSTISKVTIILFLTKPYFASLNLSSQ